MKEIRCTMDDIKFMDMDKHKLWLIIGTFSGDSRINLRMIKHTKELLYFTLT